MTDLLTGTTPGPWHVDLWHDALGAVTSVCITEPHGAVIAALAGWDEMEPRDAGLLALAPTLAAVAERAVTARAAQIAYYGDKRPPNSKHDLLVAARVAENALDKAIIVLLEELEEEAARHGGE